MRRVWRKTTPRAQYRSSRDVPWQDPPLAVIVRVPGPGYRHVVDEATLRRFLALIPDWPRVSQGLRAIVLDEGHDTREGYYRRGVLQLYAWPDPPSTTIGASRFAAHAGLWERLGVESRPAPEFIDAVEWLDDFRTLRAVEEILWDRFDSFDWEFEPGAGEDEWLALDVGDKPARRVVCDLARIDDELHIYHRAVHLRLERWQATAYLLLHVLLHELGHHVDRSTWRREWWRREQFAEHWALRCADAIWDRYMEELGPRRR